MLVYRSLLFKILFLILALLVVSGLLIAQLVTEFSKNALFETSALLAFERTKRIKSRLTYEIGSWTNLLEIIQKTPSIDTFSPQKVQLYLASVKLTYPQVQSIFISKRNGDTLLSSGATTNLSDRDYFRAALRGETTVSQPIIGKVSGKPLVTVMRPLYADNGIVGALGLAVELSRLSALVNIEPFGKTGYSFMVDKSGLILAHPNESLLMTRDDEIDNAASTGLRAVLLRMVSQESGNASYRYHNADKIVSFMPLGINQWSIGSGINHNEIYEGIDDIARSIFFVQLSGVLFVGLIFLFLIYTMVLKPIKRLTELVKSFKSGDLPARLVAPGKDEIAYLEDNFYQMAQSVSSTIQRLTSSDRSLRNSLIERETMLNEINHRVKNNFNSIVAILTLQKRSLLDAKAQEVLSTSIDRIYSMALVQDVLYQSENISMINVRDYLNRLMAHLEESYKRPNFLLHIVKDIDPIVLEPRKVLPLGLIINELFTNTIKHAFPQKTNGTFSLTVKRGDALVLCSISDDGIGLPVQWSLQQDKNLGYELIKILIEQLDGQFSLTPGLGFRLSLEFKDGQ